MTSHPVPDAILNQHVAVLGKTRSGKSSVMRGLVEGLLDREQPVCIVDPKGDWWGIKLARDGKRAGYPVVIFGGEHADVPINALAGAAVAELFATGNRPCLIDLGGWTVGDRTRFWIDFASSLFKHTCGSRWLVVDEFHNFAPKGKIMDPDAGKALHWSNRLASEGLGKGLVMLFASQRPQKVHNDALTSAETLIAMRVLHPSDRAAIADWIKGCGDLARGAAVLDSLAQMPRGEGWVWSPEIGFGPERVKFPMFKTYDSFRAQTADDARSLKGWAEVDLDDVKARLAIVIEEAAASDPKRLKGKIAQLERALAEATKKAPAETPPPGPSVRDVQAACDAAKLDGFTEGVKAGSAAVIEHVATAISGLVPALTEIPKSAATLPALVRLLPTPHRFLPLPPLRVEERASRPPASHPRPQPVPKTNGSAGSFDLSGPQRQLLGAIAWWRAMGHAAPARAQVAAIAGWRITSGHLKNIAGSLRSLGLIDYPSEGSMGLTAAGIAVAPDPDISVTISESVRGILNGPQRQVFDALLASGKSLTREKLCDKIGWNITSGHVKNVLGSLRSLEVVDYPTAGEVELVRWVTA